MSLSIRFVEPRPPGHNVYDHVLLPRLGLPLMAKEAAQRVLGTLADADQSRSNAALIAALSIDS
jgi:hypothetical protein